MEICNTIEATNPQDNISASTKEPVLDIEGNYTNTATQEPVLALRRRKHHVVTQEPTVISKAAPRELVVGMGEMIKHKR